jgi:hypothetical protein
MSGLATWTIRVYAASARAQTSGEGCVALFADSDDVYRHLGGLIAELLADERVLLFLQRIDAVVQSRLREPSATITADLRIGHPATLMFGATNLKPEIVISASADVAHLLWLDRLDPTIALARDQMAATGPIERLLGALRDSGSPGPRYERRLKGEDRPDLLMASDTDHRTLPDLAAQA